MEAKGPIRESNPGPPAPKAGIMPLDQSDSLAQKGFSKYTYPRLFGMRVRLKSDIREQNERVGSHRLNLLCLGNRCRTLV